MWAVSEPHPEIVHLLLEAGADPHLSTVKGFTPLMFAARNGDIATAEALIAAGVDVNEPSADGTHALPFAITSAQDAFARFLLEQGADPNSTINGISGSARGRRQRRHVARGLVPPARPGADSTRGSGHDA